eukprot:TRINITY_DN2769_c1_g2_i2.p2 TRINITY_DN2769_c1_g2~~TRINITY_DN2769_c1_g2_i2.p2  ORF type:complete len:257 (+),score=44.07 TRINITY_DN2769_c1_g2_i2:205-975(+)
MEGDGPALAVLSEKQLQTVVRTYAESDAPIEQFRDVSDLLRRMDIADDVVSAEDVARVGWDEASGVRMDCDTFIRVVRLCKAKVVGVVRSEDTDNREMMEGLLLDDPNELPVEWIAGILGTMDINARLPAHDGKISRATLERFLCTTPLYAAEEVVFTPGVGGDSPDADPCSSRRRFLRAQRFIAGGRLQRLRPQTATQFSASVPFAIPARGPQGRSVRKMVRPPCPPLPMPTYEDACEAHPCGDALRSQTPPAIL